MNLSIQRYTSRVFALLRSRTALDASFVLGGNLGSALLRFAVSVLLARALSPGDWGYLVVFMTLMDIVATVCDAGLNTAMVKFVAADAAHNSVPLIRCFFAFKIVLFVAMFGVAFGCAPYFLKQLEVPGSYAWVYAYAVFAGAVLSLNSFTLSVFQAFQQFRAYAFAANAINAVRLVVLGAALLYGVRETRPLFQVFFLSPVAAMVLTSAALVVPLRARRANPPATVDNRAILRFTWPLAVLALATIALQRIDVLMLQTMTTPEEVGAYGLAGQIAFVFPLLTGALVLALLPKVSAKKNHADLRDYRRKVLFLYPAILVLTALGVLIAPWIILLLFGDKFVAAIPILRVLVLAFGLHIIYNPLSLIFYALDRPYVVTAIHLAQLPILVAINLVLIPQMGALGATVAALVVRVLGVAAIVVLTWAALREPTHIVRRES